MKWFKLTLPVVTVLSVFVFYPAYKRYNISPKKSNLLAEIVEQMDFKSDLNIVSLLEKDWKKKRNDFTLPEGLPPYQEIHLPELKEKIVNIPAPSFVKEVELSPHYKVNVSSIVTADVLNKKLQGVLKNKGEVIINKAQTYNICPIFLTAVLMHESANGCSNFAEDRNNVAGIMTNAKVKVKGKWIVKSVGKYFETVDDCIGFTAKLLGGKAYAGGKRNTIKSIQQVYCPIGADNDPKKLNGHWLGGVMGYMEKLWGKVIHIRS